MSCHVVNSLLLLLESGAPKAAHSHGYPAQQKAMGDGNSKERFLQICFHVHFMSIYIFVVLVHSFKHSRAALDSTASKLRWSVSIQWAVVKC